MALEDEIFDLEVDESPQDLLSATDQRLRLLANEDHEEEQTFRSALRRRNSLQIEEGGVHSSPRSPEIVEPQLQPEPLIIGISGGTASGKTSVCKAIHNQLHDQRVALITLDSYYRSLSTEEKELVTRGEFNFDHPNAFDWDLVREHLASILKRQPISVPAYDYINNERFPDKSVQIAHVDVVFFEGILAFWDPKIREMLSLKIFVECDSDIRLARRVIRDIAERGRDLDHILDQYEKTVKPSFDKFTLPTKRFADVIIPRGAANIVAIQLLADHVGQKLLSIPPSPQIGEETERRRRTTSQLRPTHARAEAQILDVPASPASSRKE